MLRCWWGGGGALVAVRDDRGGGCDVALLGRRPHYQGVRAVADVGRLARHCRGRRAVVSGLKREVTINMLLGGACGKACGWGGHSVHHGCHQKQRPLRQQSAVAAFFARMEVVVSGESWRAY